MPRKKKQDFLSISILTAKFSCKTLVYQEWLLLLLLVPSSSNCCCCCCSLEILKLLSVMKIARGNDYVVLYAFSVAWQSLLINNSARERERAREGEEKRTGVAKANKQQPFAFVCLSVRSLLWHVYVMSLIMMKVYKTQNCYQLDIYPKEKKEGNKRHCSQWCICCLLFFSVALSPSLTLSEFDTHLIWAMPR